jgi:hypothetical protein
MTMELTAVGAAARAAWRQRGFGAKEAHCTGYRFERIPLTAADRFLRGQVKRVIGFRD